MAVSTVANVSPQQVARDSALLLSNKLRVLKSGIPDHSSKFKAGQSGATVKIAKPTKVSVVTGTWDVTSSPNANREAYASLTMSRTPISVPHILTDDQRMLDYEDMKQQMVNPSISRLASEIERRFLLAVCPSIASYAGAASMTDASIAEISRQLADNLCPMENIKGAIAPRLGQDLRQDTKGLFNAARSVGDMNVDGVVTRWNGIDFLEPSTLLPLQTTGSRAASSISTTVTEGSTTVAMDIGSGTETVKAGEIFYIAACKAVNDQTKQLTGDVRKFVVLADAAAVAGIVSLTVTEAIYASSSDNRQNVSRLPTSGDAVIWVGAASDSGILQGIFYDPMAFATAFGDLPVDDEANGYVTTVPGTKIRLRYERQKNSATGQTVFRWDVLPAWTCVEPAFAARFLRTASVTSA